MLASAREGYLDLDAPQRTNWSRRRLAVAVVVLFTWGGCLLSLQEPRLGESSLHQRDGAGNALLREKSLSFVVKTLSSSYAPIATLSLYRYEHVVEPYKTTSLLVKSPTAENSSSSFHWTIRAQSGEVEAVYVGIAATHVFKAVAHTYSITLEELSEAGEVLGSVTSSATCKYIRRDTHRMHDEDRERTLRAMRIMFDLDGDEGRALYGPKYYSFNELLVLHLDRDTQLRCTPWHAGSVFLTAHQAMSLTVEQSLQAIDPSLSLPWMDLSYEVSLGEDWRSSPMFGPDWFGSFGKAEDNYRITDSIFAGVRIPTDCSKPEKNAYCRLTDSFNQDDSEYLTRAGSICGLSTTGTTTTCSLILSVLELASYSDFVTVASELIHADLHGWLGGSWDCPFSVIDALNLDPTNADLQLFLEGTMALGTVGVGQTFMSNDALIQCPTDCEGLPVSSCRCYCPSIHKMVEEGYSLYEASYYIVDQYGRYSDLPDVLATLPSDDAREALVVWIAGFLCTPGRLAPFSSPLGAPNDPLFMPTHAFFDAMVTSMYMRNPDFKDDWVNDDSCWGHNWLAQLPFHDFVNEHNAFYTNQQLQGFFHPLNPALPYIYDDLNFANCKVTTPI